MSEIFTSAEQLRAAFKLEDHTDYLKFTPFTRDLGFSVQRKYPDKCRYSPPVTKNGEPTTYAQIGVLYEPKRCDSRKPHIIPVSANVRVFHRYISNHLDYNFEDENSPTEESVIASKKTPHPADLSAWDEYAYDHERDAFLDSDGNIIEGIQIIEGLYQNHLATVDKFKGLVFRWKLASKNRAGVLYGELREFFKWVLKKVCGRTLETDEFMRGVHNDYRPEDVKLLKTERIDVFGYKASKNVIVTFCILSLAGYSFLHWNGVDSPWLKGVAGNSLLAFAFSIVCITCVDHVLPKMLLCLINALNRRRLKAFTATVKFK